jgi:hypothetical protein
MACDFAGYVVLRRRCQSALAVGYRPLQSEVPVSGEKSAECDSRQSVLSARWRLVR